MSSTLIEFPGNPPFRRDLLVILVKLSASRASRPLCVSSKTSSDSINTRMPLFVRALRDLTL
jgi:hypothetical protein